MFVPFFADIQSEQNSGAYIFRPEQGNRLGVGSDNDGQNPYLKSAWNFIDPYPGSATMSVFVTPRADVAYMDTFATSVRSLSPQQFAVTTGRVDGQQPQPDPWGQSIAVDFLALDRTASPPQGFQLGSQNIGNSPGASYRLIAVSFTSAYSSAPRVLVSIRASADNNDLFVASIVQVTSKVGLTACCLLSATFSSLDFPYFFICSIFIMPDLSFFGRLV